MRTPPSVSFPRGWLSTCDTTDVASPLAPYQIRGRVAWNGVIDPSSDARAFSPSRLLCVTLSWSFL